jgi:hypothetical protein
MLRARKAAIAEEGGHRGRPVTPSSSSLKASMNTRSTRCMDSRPRSPHPHIQAHSAPAEWAQRFFACSRPYRPHPRFALDEPAWRRRLAIPPRRGPPAALYRRPATGDAQNGACVAERHPGDHQPTGRPGFRPRSPAFSTRVYSCARATPRRYAPSVCWSIAEKSV